MKFLFTSVFILFIFTSLNAQITGNYKVTGYFFHPSVPRAINLTKTITLISQNVYQVDLGDVGPNGSYFRFSIDTGNNLVNWVASGATPVAPASGFMTADNPGSTAFPGAPVPPGTAPWIHSVYNNKYDPINKIFYMHYGYQAGSTSQAGFTRQVYEKWEAPKPADITNVTPLTGTYGTQVTITGKNFNTVETYGVYFGSHLSDTFRIVSDTLIHAWVGGGGSGNVRVVNPDGADTFPGFTYVPIPAVLNPGWHNLGSAGFTTGRVTNVHMAVDKNNVAYTAFSDTINGAVRVMKYFGGSWTAVGTGISNGGRYVKIAHDTANRPVVAFCDVANANLIIVKRFDGTNWIDLAMPTARGKFSMAINAQNDLYLLAVDTSRVNVFRLTGNNWTSTLNIGTTQFSSVDIAIDKTTNYPCVIYDDNTVSGQVTVKRFNGSSWSTVGTPGFTAASGGIFYATIRVDNLGAPVVAMQEDNGFERLNIYKFTGGTWSKIGNNVSQGRAYDVNLAISKTNKLYVAFRDYSYNSKGTVRVLNNTSWDTVGRRGFAPFQEMNAFVLDTADKPLMAFYDLSNSNRASVLKLSVPCQNNDNRWTGDAGTDFNNPVNWACFMVAGPNTDVTVQPGEVMSIQTNTTVNTLTLTPGATFTVAPGVNLIIKNP